MTFHLVGNFHPSQLAKSIIFQRGRYTTRPYDIHIYIYYHVCIFPYIYHIRFPYRPCVFSQSACFSRDQIPKIHRRHSEVGDRVPDQYPLARQRMVGFERLECWHGLGLSKHYSLVVDICCYCFLLMVEGISKKRSFCGELASLWFICASWSLVWANRKCQQESVLRWTCGWKSQPYKGFMVVS